MVKLMENPVKMDDLGVKPTIFGNIHLGVNIHTWTFTKKPDTASMERTAGEDPLLDSTRSYIFQILLGIVSHILLPP